MVYFCGNRILFQWGIWKQKDYRDIASMCLKPLAKIPFHSSQWLIHFKVLLEDLQNIYNQKPRGGLCEVYTPQWCYDVEAGESRKFIYVDCHGNRNRYSSKEECMEHCSGQ